MGTPSTLPPPRVLPVAPPFEGLAPVLAVIPPTPLGSAEVEARRRKAELAKSVSKTHLQEHVWLEYCGKAASTPTEESTTHVGPLADVAWQNACLPAPIQSGPLAGVTWGCDEQLNVQNTQNTQHNIAPPMVQYQPNAVQIVPENALISPRVPEKQKVGEIQNLPKPAGERENEVIQTVQSQPCYAEREHGLEEVVANAAQSESHIERVVEGEQYQEVHPVRQNEVLDVLNEVLEEKNAVHSEPHATEIPVRKVSPGSPAPPSPPSSSGTWVFVATSEVTKCDGVSTASPTHSETTVFSAHPPHPSASDGVVSASPTHSDRTTLSAHPPHPSLQASDGISTASPTHSEATVFSVQTAPPPPPTAPSVETALPPRSRSLPAKPCRQLLSPRVDGVENIPKEHLHSSQMPPTPSIPMQLRSGRSAVRTLPPSVPTGVIWRGESLTPPVRRDVWRKEGEVNVVGRRRRVLCSPPVPVGVEREGRVGEVLVEQGVAATPVAVSLPEVGGVGRRGSHVALSLGRHGKARIPLWQRGGAGVVRASVEELMGEVDTVFPALSEKTRTKVLYIFFWSQASLLYTKSCYVQATLCMSLTDMRFLARFNYSLLYIFSCLRFILPILSRTLKFTFLHFQLFLVQAKERIEAALHEAAVGVCEQRQLRHVVTPMLVRQVPPTIRKAATQTPLPCP